MRRFALLALAGSVFAGNAFAATTPINGDFLVQATVPESCVFVSDTGIDFGTYDPVDAHAAADDTAQGNIVVRCTKGTTITVTLDDGLNGSGTCAAPARAMTNGTETLDYNILVAAAGTEWGCDAANDVGATATSSTSNISLTTYGVIPMNQDVGVGDYEDTVSYTVTL